MYKADYLNFIKINLGKDDGIKNGSFSIWICNQKNNHGYKLYFKDWGGPMNFLVAKNIRERRHPKKDPSKGHKLVGMKKLKAYFKFCNKLFNLGLIPKPIRIFEYKSVYGIKQTNIPPITSDKLWKDRYNTLLPQYLKIWHEGYSKWLLNDKQKHNFGQVGDKILMLDIDVHGMEDIRKTLQ